MRKLHLVGLTTDRDGLIFTARKGSKSGGFIVPMDETVLAAVAEVQAVRNGGPAAVAVELGEIEPVPRRPRHQSALTPREMQARLRAGRSIDEVAAEAGVDHEWVARFAVPILAEQAQVVELARGLVYAKPRLGESAQPLGPSVMQNLSDRGLFLPDDVADAGWSAFQLHDSVWLVRFRYRSRGRSQEAQWEVDVPAGRLQARNRHASDLGYVEAGGRRRVPAEEEGTDDDTGAPRPAPRPRRKPATPRARSAATARATTAAGTRRAAVAAGPVAKKAKRPTTVPRASTTAKATGRSTAKTAKAAKAPPPAGRPAATTTKKPAAGRASKVAGRSPAPASKVGGRSPAPTSKVAGRSPAPASKVAGRSPAPAGKAAGRSPAGGRTRKSSSTVPTAVATSPPAAVARIGTQGTPPKPSAGRRPAAADPGPDAGPAARSGGVRSAVAQVSTARVTASLAAAERAPWAGAVRQRSGSRLAPVNGDRSTQKPAPPRDEDAGRAFEPRPLPPGGGTRPVASRVRKVSVPSAPSRSPGEAPPVSLPAPRVPPPPAEPIPAERTKRRRLRPR